MAWAPEAARASTPLAGCEARFTADPESRESSRCFYRLAQGERDRDEAARRLRALLAGTPHNAWAEYYLASIELLRDGPDAGNLYRRAAHSFSLRGDFREEVYARINQVGALSRNGRLAEAGEELDRVAARAESLGDPTLLAEVRVAQARHLLRTGEDLGRAYRLLRGVEAEVFPNGPYTLRIACLRALGIVADELGRPGEAFSYYRRYDALVSDAGDLYAEAGAKYNLATASMDRPPREVDREALLELLHAALDAARTAGHRRIEARAHLLLGRLLTGAEGRRHLEQCLAIATSDGLEQQMSGCLHGLAVKVVESDPGEARRLIGRALRTASEAEAPWAAVYGWSDRMRVSWATRPRRQAVADSLAELDVIKALRDLQGSAPGRAGLFSVWTDAYYWLSGRLLDDSRGPVERRDLEQAFSVTERMRARVLLETLDAARDGGVPPSAEPLIERREAVLRGIVATQRRLLDPELGRQDRTPALAELEGLELEEAELRHRIDEARGTRRRSAPPAFATLERVERGLDRNQALLSFQVGPWTSLDLPFAGGSWLLASTRGGTRAYRLPGRAELEPAIALFLGLVERRDGSETAGAERLHRDLLRRALEDLPADVDELIVVPDGVLHRLPFGALRNTGADRPLTARYAISVVPSATLWLRSREQERTPPEVPALVLADPALPGEERWVRAAEERGWLLEADSSLGGLPFARREGRALIRRLGGASRLLNGSEATEDLLKRTDLRRYGVLHFAAHALVDERRPDRSAVLLAAGAATEDGLLQAREIADLDLEGRLVVLSACRSASGEVLRGEGPMSLARAFFQAGAPTVVGSLWPLHDEDAAALFDGFYRHLASGLTVAGALTAAQREWIRAGAPLAAWAGVVVLGDGDLVPLPGGAPASTLPGGLPIALAVLLAVVFLAALPAATRLLRRRRP